VRLRKRDRPVKPEVMTTTMPVIKTIVPPTGATSHSDLRSSQPSGGCLGNV
jgi:hypothetical protein